MNELFWRLISTLPRKPLVLFNFRRLHFVMPHATDSQISVGCLGVCLPCEAYVVWTARPTDEETTTNATTYDVLQEPFSTHKWLLLSLASSFTEAAACVWLCVDY